MKKLILALILILICHTYIYAGIESLDEVVDPSLDSNVLDSTGEDLRLTIFANFASQNTMNGEVYAQYPTQWTSGEIYTADNQFVVHGGALYFCSAGHTADSTTEPGVGASWATVWTLLDTTAVNTAYDDIGNPDANTEIDHGPYIIEHNTEDFRIGDGGDNYFGIRSNGGVIEAYFNGNAGLYGGLASDSVTDDNLETTGQITVHIDGGGSAITTGPKTYFPVEYDLTITDATIICDQTGSIVIDVWKDVYSTTTLPTVADTITASAPPTLSSAVMSKDSTLTGWTTTVTAGDVVGFNVNSATTVEFCTITLGGTR